MQRLKRLPKWAMVGGAISVFVVGLIALWWVLVPGSVETAPALPETQESMQLARAEEEIEIPDAYLFQYFLTELQDCYRQIEQPISLPRLERQVGKDWDVATLALTDYYIEGKCQEEEFYLRIPGRAAWMIEQVLVPTAEEEE